MLREAGRAAIVRAVEHGMGEAEYRGAMYAAEFVVPKQDMPGYLVGCSTVSLSIL